VSRRERYFVSRTRCGIFHAAPREAGTVTGTAFRNGPGSAAHRKSAALRPGHDVAAVRPVSVTLIVLVRLHIQAFWRRLA
jgi:hypothetical protein